ncbi:MAG TPA: hypothetical protein VFZ64_02400 [Nocardioidaceae bacterium]
MSTSTKVGGDHWSPVLGLLVPGPLALSMRAWVDPSGWLALRTRRYVDGQRAEDEPASTRLPPAR